MSVEQQRRLRQTVRQRASGVADAWYETIRAASPASSSPDTIRGVVDDASRQIEAYLLAEDTDPERLDALARQLISLRLPPEALGTLQEVLIGKLMEEVSGPESAALGRRPRQLIADLTTSLLRGSRAVVLEEQEHTVQAYGETLQRVQEEIRLKDTALQQQIVRLRTLRQIDQCILAADSAGEIGEAALHHLQQLVPCRLASVALFDLEQRQAEILAAVPSDAFDAGRSAESFSLTGWEEVLDALQRGGIHVIDDVLGLPLPNPVRKWVKTRPPRALAVVPLRCEGELLGALSLALEDRRDLTDQHGSIAQEVAGSLAVAIRQTQLDATIARHREQLRAMTARLAEIDEEKRSMLTRYLHDQIGHRLTALGINLNVIKSELEAERAPQVASRLDDSLTLLSETTDRVRRVMGELRPPMLDDYGLLPTLRWFGEQLASRSGVDVAVHAREPDPRLPASIEDALVRITQEALTNVAKHAQASRVSIVLSVKEGIRLIISDDGVGFDPTVVDRASSAHWGFFTMTARAEAVNGRCRVRSQPGEGTQVIVEVER